MNETKQKHKMPHFVKRIIFKAVLILAIVLAAFIAFLMLRAKIENLFNIKIDLPQFIENRLPDALMGYNKVDFVNAVKGEAREKRSLVVLEQDVNATTEISNAFGNIAIFKKSKTMHSYGTGVFTVDLSQMADSNITVNVWERTVTVKIPPVQLDYVTVDNEKTTFEDTEHALLGFGDITLTEEQQQQVTLEIDAAMREVLNSESVQKAAEAAAKTQTQALFEGVVSAMSQGFTVKII